MSNARIVVTGASGFIGAALCEHLNERGRLVTGAVRKARDASAPWHAPVGDLAEAQEAALDALLDGADAVIHLAGRAHVMRESLRERETLYHLANAESTRRIARAAARMGVRRFVLASTVKVNGESTRPGHPFRPEDLPRPGDAYARSKLEAERELFDAVAGSSTRPVVLRFPLVYGRNAKGNFARLVAAIVAGRMLPVASIRNRRSLVYLGNLIDAIEAVVDAPSAPGGVHFVADDESPSTPELVRAIARAWHKQPRMLSVPVPLLRTLAAASGRSALVMRLTESLEVDTGSLRAAVPWYPRCSLPEAMARIAPAQPQAAAVGPGGRPL